MGWKINFYLMMLGGMWLEYLLWPDWLKKEMKKYLWETYGGKKPKFLRGKKMRIVKKEAK